MNVEHLLDFFAPIDKDSGEFWGICCRFMDHLRLHKPLLEFTSIDKDSKDFWVTCCRFMDHLRWHKPRLVILRSKIEALPDNHPSKPECLLALSGLFQDLGNWVEQRRVLFRSLNLWIGWRNDYGIACTLTDLSEVNRRLGRHKEGLPQAKEALRIFTSLGDTENQASCLLVLASLLQFDGQLDAAEEAATRAMDLSKNCDQLQICNCHKVLGDIHESKGSTKKAVYHLNECLKIATLINSRRDMCKSHLGLAGLYFEEENFEDAHRHIKQAKSCARDDELSLGCMLFLSAHILHYQNRVEEGKSEASRALAIFKEIGARDLAKGIRQLLKILGSGDEGEPSKWCSLSHLFTPLIQTWTPNRMTRLIQTWAPNRMTRVSRRNCAPCCIYSPLSFRRGRRIG